ncbi:hypothetical protein FANTH_5768 [Fusarium anthophilum]|uniref:Uncharacterized protein n=1 Tax=Fusarium anthophilum TaxID=48485 RepID=A0A8H4ZKU6_9HYPO|nr:hypothetical protein FANTH_5768 [Fusarium anthophilum]
MVGTIYAMMEVHFQAKATQIEPPKEDIFKTYIYARRSEQVYDEQNKLLKFKIYDNFDNAAKVVGELWNLLRKENVLENWDFQELFLMTNMGQVCNPLEDERLLKVYEMPTFEEFLDRLFPSTARTSST